MFEARKISRRLLISPMGSSVFLGRHLCSLRPYRKLPAQIPKAAIARANRSDRRRCNFFYAVSYASQVDVGDTQSHQN